MRSTVRSAGIGLPQGIALYVASVLGTGLLVLPGTTAAVAGPGSIVAVIVVILLSIPLAGTFAAVAARYPDPGGVASHVRRALGPTAARMTGYWFQFGVAAGAPVVAVLGADYVAATIGAGRGAVPWIAIALFLPPFALNMFGVRLAGGVQFVLMGLLVTVVVLVVAWGAPSVEAGAYQPFLPHGWAGVGMAVSLFVWAFAGWEVGTHISGEFRRPRRDIPLATAIALAVTAVAYLLLQIVTVGALGTGAGSTPTPLLDLARLGAPDVGPVAVGVVAAIVSVGVLNAYLAAFGKLGASLAENGDLPRWLARGAGRGQAPRRALAVTGALAAGYFAALVSGGMNLTPFILIHTSSMVCIYVLGMAAAVRLLPRGSAGWVMAVIAVVLCVGLVALAWASLLPALLLAAAAVIVGFAQRRRTRRAV